MAGKPKKIRDPDDIQRTHCMDCGCKLRMANRLGICAPCNARRRDRVAGTQG